MQSAPNTERILSAPETRRLVFHFCRRLCHNPEVAEDLAQETMVEAWRHQSQLRVAEAWQAWLNGISRNVYLRWQRRIGTEGYRLVSLGEEVLRTHEPCIDPITDVLNEQERSEYGLLIEKALRWLPAGARLVINERLLEERSVGEVAQRHGLTEGMVRVRLNRARQQLHRVFQTHLKAEADAFGANEQRSPDSHQETRIWCPYCGISKLQ